jgi:DMSO reductase family type II enzyme heme b subunit
MRIELLVCCCAALLAPACQRSTPPAPSTEVVAALAASLPTDPDDAAWSVAAPFAAPMIPQDMVEPRQVAPTTGELIARALCDGERLAVRLEWSDPTSDDELRPAHFSDGCALQLPAYVQADIPAPQMGEPGKPVEITFWRAAWQAAVEGRKGTLASLYPNAAIDHYPFEAAAANRELADVYSPARALGNDVGTRTSAVQDLVASGPGTLGPRSSAISSGHGRRTAQGWAVVITRPLPAGLAPGQRTQIAFAVWRGEAGEVGARKMRTGWIPLAVEVRP